MTRDELFKDLWNTVSLSCDTPYKQWVKQGFDWMYGWHEYEVQSLTQQLSEAKKETEQQRFNNENNLSIDQKVSDEIDKLKKELEAEKDINAQAKTIIEFELKYPNTEINRREMEAFIKMGERENVN